MHIIYAYDISIYFTFFNVKYFYHYYKIEKKEKFFKSKLEHMYTAKQLWRTITNESFDKVYERKMDKAINRLVDKYEYDDREYLRENLMKHIDKDEIVSTTFFVGVITDKLIIDNFNLIDQLEFKLRSDMIAEVSNTYGSKYGDKNLCLINALYSPVRGYRFIFYILDKYDKTAKRGSIYYRFDNDMVFCSSGSC